MKGWLSWLFITLVAVLGDFCSGQNFSYGRNDRGKKRLEEQMDHD
jgi:hypothetical protein